MLVSIAWRAVVVDMIQTYICTTPLGNPAIRDQLRASPLYIRAARGLLPIFAVRYLLEMVYRVPAVVTVALGICDPWQWPPLMGNLRDGYTIRRFWS